MNKLIFSLLLISYCVYAQEYTDPIEEYILIQPVISEEGTTSENQDYSEESDLLFIQHIPVKPNYWQEMVQSLNKDYNRIEAYIINNNSIDKPVIDNNTLLHLAAMQSNQKLLSLGLKHSGNLSIKNSYGDTPIHWLAAQNYLPILQSGLADIVFDINSLKNDHSLTPLHFNLLYSTNTATTKYLLTHTKSLNEQDNNGLTALHYAIMFDKYEQATLLIQNNADLYIKDNEGLNVEDYILNRATVDGMNMLYPFLSEKTKAAIFSRAKSKG